MINLEQYPLFAENKATLKQTSMDDSIKDEIQYMTESQMEVIDFDMVKRYYANSLGCSEECAASVDAIFPVNDNSIVFVEFKNGRVKNQNVKNKLRDSLLIFLDVTGKTISYTRKPADFIVVYNAEENSGAVKQKQKELQVSPSRVAIGSWVCAKAKEELVLFDLGKYAPIYYRTVHTYSREQFEEYLGTLKP